MKRIALGLLLLLVTLNAFAHAGEVHKYMGTIDTLNADGSFLLMKTDGTTMTVLVSSATNYRHADGSAGVRADLQKEMRVVVTISKDGKTASEVRYGAKK